MPIPLPIKLSDEIHSCLELVDVIANMVAQSTTFDRFDKSICKLIVESNNSVTLSCSHTPAAIELISLFIRPCSLVK